MAEATQDAAKPARKKNAHYDVYRQGAYATGPETEDAWILIAGDVQASNRREAVGAATAIAGLDDLEAYGTFMVIRHGEAQVLTRAKKTIVADDWGAA